MLSLNVNGRDVQVDAPPEMPLLWVLRDLLNLTGTKYGCGVMACGACTVLLDGAPTRTCLTPASAAAGKALRTIESLGPAGTHALQRAWVAEQVPQCGYCQSGMLMAATALLEKNPAPSDADIDAAITNLCRCGTYPRVRAGIHRAAAELQRRGPTATARSADTGPTEAA
ncbi:MAG: (2Fe-2S)-binding protein [Betaproteobacteria bacterium]|nr:(2Fe-2S)-binding protein [Betaproteobacteria bacterium]MDE2048804.1 (2Fe-2S)-binding protein [Betaproteobacteria bacterium]